LPALTHMVSMGHLGESIPGMSLISTRGPVAQVDRAAVS
jgi:hypothetical protein